MALAVSGGKTQPWGRHMIPGAPSQMALGKSDRLDLPSSLWLLRPAPFPITPGTIFPATVRPHSSGEDLGYIQRYTGLLYGTTSPTAAQASNRLNSRLFILRPLAPPGPSHPRRRPRSYDTLWNRTYTGGWDGTNESADYASDLTLAVRAASVSGVPLLTRTFMFRSGTPRMRSTSR